MDLYYLRNPWPKKLKEPGDAFKENIGTPEQRRRIMRKVMRVPKNVRRTV